MAEREQAIELMNKLGASAVPFLFIIDFDLNEFIVEPIAEIDPQKFLYDINGVSNARFPPGEVVSPKLASFPLSFAEYQRRFEQIMFHLRRGDSYLINLTCAVPIELNLSLREVFALSRAKYRLLYGDNFVVFSPETFVTIRDGHVATFPMKGTIDASEVNAASKLENDPKEIAEHTTIVDLLRNDLSLIAEEVQVEDFRYLEKIKAHDRELLQVSSKITGKLSADYARKIGSIIVSMLPAGSVTGAPKKRTVEIIKAVEEYERGFYTGVFGYFDGSNLDSAVMIRFIEQNNRGLVYKSGGGITVNSNAGAEYEELLKKIYVPIV